MTHPGSRAGLAPDSRRPDGKIDARLGALLPLLAAALYLGTLSSGFVWDDFQLVFLNQYLRRLSDLPAWIFLNADQISFGEFSGGFYRPGTLLSLAADFALWGEHPGGFHLTSLLAHAAVTLAVFRLGRSLDPRPGPAAAAALLFAVHPVHVEAVAWISARADLLATLGVLLAVLAYRRARPAEGGLSRGWYCAALLAGAAGLACKETAAVLPLLLMVADLLGPALGGAPSGRLGGVAVRSLPFWGLAVGYLALLSRPLQTYSAHLLAPGELWARIPGSLETLARYLGLLLLPVGMRPYYALERPAGLLAPWPLLGALLTAGLLLLLCALWRKAPRAAFGLAWLLITLLPVLDLAAVSPRPMGLADRYLYLPSVGFLLGAVFLADAAFRRLGPPWHRLPAAVTVLLALAGTLLTAGYLPVWRDNLSLYSRMVRDAPAAALPRLNLATTHLDRGDVDRGVALLEEAIRLEPTWVRPQIVLGLVLVGRGEVARGLALFDRAAPRAQEDINYYRMRSEAHLAARDPARAARVARDGLRRFPRAVDLHALLGRALEASGETAEAVLAQREVLRLDPQRAAAAEALGRLLARQGDFDGAGRALSRALDLEPRRLTALRLLALVRQAEGRREESLRLWERLADEAVDPALRGEAEAMRRALAGGRPGPAR